MRLAPWCLGLLLLAAPSLAVASFARAPSLTPMVDASATLGAAKSKAKRKKPVDKCDSIGKPCKEGDDCKPDNCKPGGQAPEPEN